MEVVIPFILYIVEATEVIHAAIWEAGLYLVSGPFNRGQRRYTGRAGYIAVENRPRLV